MRYSHVAGRVVVSNGKLYLNCFASAEEQAHTDVTLMAVKSDGVVGPRF